MLLPPSKPQAWLDKAAAEAEREIHRCRKRGRHAGAAIRAIRDSDGRRLALTTMRMLSGPLARRRLAWWHGSEKSDKVTRLAMLEAWGEECVWCRRPIYYSDMEVEHLIPKSLDGQDITHLLDGHGLAKDFDLFSLENLAPSCGRCNDRKGFRPAPDAPFVTILLGTARERAPKIAEAVEKLRGKKKLERALVLVEAAAASGR